jgi:hypothetical protein
VVRIKVQFLVPVAGLVPAAHVFGNRQIEPKGDVDGRAEPGHGDLEFYQSGLLLSAVPR